MTMLDRLTTIPKLLWLTGLACCTTFLFGIPAIVAMRFIESRTVSIVLTLGCFLLIAVGGICVAAFVLRFALGRYSNLQKKPLRDQIW